MVHLKKITALFLTAALLSTAMSPCVLAASKKKVGRIELTVDSDARVGNSGGEVEITPTGDNTDLYWVESAEIINDSGDNWIRSMPPMVEVNIGLEDEDEYAFSGTSSNYFKLTLGSSSKSRFDKISFAGASKKDGGATIVLKFRLVFDNEADTRGVDSPMSVKWDESRPGVATWSEVSSAKYFQLELYKDGNQVSTTSDSTSYTRTVYNTSYDFTKAFVSDGAYQFRIRSVRASNNAKSSWVTSNTLIVVDGKGTESTPVSTSDGPGGPEGSGSWQKASDGVRWWWKDTDGSSPVSQWKEINSKWYYFDAEGYMATGWITLDGVSYYLDTSTGAMYTNCRTPDNYWVNESGAWVPGM